MKKVKLNASLKAGFSLVEMLVVIAIIGIIAAIAIPNIGSINDSARIASAQRNAQSVASVLNAAFAAGAATPAGWSDATTGITIVTAAETGLTPDDGPFDGKKFTTGPIDDEEDDIAAQYLSFDLDNKQVIYNSTITPTLD